MAKQIKITDLTLNDNNILVKQEISIDTNKRIEKIVTEAKQEKDAINALNQKAMQSCFDLLYRRKGIPTLGSELLTTSGHKNLSVLMLKFSSFLKKREDIWKIQKRKLRGQTVYLLLPK
jgi:hypothetical protein